MQEVIGQVSLKFKGDIGIIKIKLEIIKVQIKFKVLELDEIILVNGVYKKGKEGGGVNIGVF